MVEADAVWESHLRRQIRIVSLLSGAHTAGISPVPALQLHTLAYLAEALAPVWGLEVFDARVLKRRRGPMSPALQRDIDTLVARGVLVAEDVHHVQDGDGWRLDARYSLNMALARPILSTIAEFHEQAHQLEFVEELVAAASGLGLEGLALAHSGDAAYSSGIVDFGGLLDLDAEGGAPNRSTEVALRFGELAKPNADLRSAEMVHLYVHALYNRLLRAS